VGENSWPRWRSEIAKACDGSHHTIESIEQSIAEGRAHVLTMPDCCYIVELAPYPQALACQIMWAAGALDAIKAALPRVEAWARLKGCSEMLVEGQAGWQRALKTQGYEPWSVTIRKPL
jgi:hypothetical protein